MKYRRVPAAVNALFLLMFAASIAVFAVACSEDPTPTPEPTATPAPTATPQPTATPTVSPEIAAFNAYMQMLEEAAIGLSDETKACLMDLFEEDPSVAEAFIAEQNLSGSTMLSFMACLTPEEIAALTGEGPIPDAAPLDEDAITMA